jgi:hypothetical protein
MSRTYRRGLTLTLVQIADQANRQQPAYGEQKNDDNHWSKGPRLSILHARFHLKASAINAT